MQIIYLKSPKSHRQKSRLTPGCWTLCSLGCKRQTRLRTITKLLAFAPDFLSLKNTVLSCLLSAGGAGSATRSVTTLEAGEETASSPQLSPDQVRKRWLPTVGLL